MTDIGVFTQPFKTEDLSWDLTPPHMGVDGSGTLSVAAFDQATHFPNGYLPSGTVLGLITSSGLLGPYLDTAVDGRTTAVGILKASVAFVQPNGTLKTKVGCAMRVAFAAVSVARLPLTSVSAPLGGYIDANGKANLPLIYFAA